MTAVDRDRLAELLDAERQRFADDHPNSRAMFERTGGSLMGGLPMPWMTRWASPFPVFVESAKGAWLHDVDGHDYLDLSLGDTGALFGHSAEPIANAIAEQAARGITFMLPTADAAAVGEALAARFGLPFWQFATTATDANRFALKMARAATGRHMIVVFDGCYHGSLDETLVTVENGVVRASAENMAPAIDPAETTRVVPFNDIDALRAALAPGDVACVLCEPALTNSGLVFPHEGFHDAMRAATREHGALLVIDETHTICAGPGGATRAFGLDPDIVTLGKPLAGGVPAATYGFTAALAEAIGDWTAGLASFVTGVIGTLSGNALGMAAMRAALEKVMTEDAYARMTAQAARLADGTTDIIAAHGLPWGVGRLGASVEYRFYPGEPANAAEAADHPDDARDALFRLFFLNRGILLTIFYNVALIAPQVEPGDIDRHNEVFAEFAALWTGLQR